jgi:hypothetical protein
VRRAETILQAQKELFSRVANALSMMISCDGPDGHAIFNKSCSASGADPWIRTGASVGVRACIPRIVIAF